MSYILDALRSSEARRGDHDPALPDLFPLRLPPPRRARADLGRLGWPVAALLVLAGVAGAAGLIAGWPGLKESVRAPASPPVATAGADSATMAAVPDPVVAPEADAAGPDVATPPSGAPAATLAGSIPLPPPAAADPLLAPPPPLRLEPLPAAPPPSPPERIATFAPNPPGPAPRPTVRPAPRPAPPPARTVAVDPPAAADPSPFDPAPADADAETAPPVPAPRGAGGSGPAVDAPASARGLEELGPAVWSRLPDIQISMHSHVGDPAARFARVNGRMVREGEFVDEQLQAVSITAGGVVFRHAGEEFFLARNADWRRPAAPGNRERPAAPGDR